MLRFIATAFVCCSVAVAAAILVTTSLPDVHRAEATVSVGTDRQLISAEFGRRAQTITNTVHQLMKADIVIAGAIERIGIKESPEKFRDGLQIHEKPKAAVFQMTLDRPTPEQAVRGLNALLVSYRENAGKVAAIAETVSPTGAASRPGPRRSRYEVKVRMFDPPHALSRKVSPRPVWNIGVAGLLALIAAFCWTAYAVGRDAAAAQRLEHPASA